MAQQRAMEVTATNIANMNTPGYRALRTQFADWLSRQNNADTPPGGRVIAYTQDRATWRDSKSGTLRQTGNPFDLGLPGEGFFALETPAGTRLTRNGRFAPLTDGTLADSAGNALLDTAGQAIRIGATDTRVVIAGDSTISSENGQLGRVGVVRPEDPTRLTAQGDTLLDPRGPTVAVTAPNITQGAIEDSNAHPVLEITRMIKDHRQFEFVAQFVRAAEERQRDAIERLLPATRAV